MSKSLKKETINWQEKAEILVSVLAKKDRQIHLKDNELLEKANQIQIQEIEALQQETEIQHLKEQYQAKQDELMALKRMIFGKKSERFVDDTTPNQIPLFDLDADQVDIDEEDLEEITYKRKRSKKKKWDLSKLPQRDVIIPVPDEDRICLCGCEKQLVRYDKKHILNHIPAVFEIIVQKREVLACKKGCEKSIVTAPVVPQVLPKCRVSESLLAYIAVSKVLDRQPLYHLEKKIEREHNWHISRQTMARWLIQLSEKLQPLINLMKEEILTYDIAAIDATTLQVLNEPDRLAETKSQAYCIRGGPPKKEATLYEYNGYKQQDYVTETFIDYAGFVSSDASPVFNGIHDKKEITVSYCHAHARRKFESIEKARTRGKGKKSKPGLAYYVMKTIYQELYKIEKEIKDKSMTLEEAYTYRQDQAKPILIGWHDWLIQHKDLTLKESPIGKAIRYALRHWKGLLVYLEDARIPIDNNATERDIKPFVIGRKNFMFACTQAGADALGVHFSLIITAKHHGLDPMVYYTEILKRIPLCKSISDYEKLLPWNFSS
jgi:transposase